VGDRGKRQDLARLVATAVFIAPLANYLIDGDWPWYPGLGFPDAVRWSAALPATLAVLFLVWACRYTEGGQEGIDKTFVTTGPYRWLRHPQLLASSIFFLSLSVLSNNVVVLMSAILGVFLLRLVVAPAVEADLETVYGKEYGHYSQKTGRFFFRLARLPKARYAVPRRFGLSAVLAFTTIFAFVFGALNYMHAEAHVYFFVATEIAAICLVQIVFVAAPRRASVFTGAILLPIWAAISNYNDLNRVPLFALVAATAMLAIFGGLLGYLIGGLAAGFFLTMDLLEPYLPGSKSDSPRPPATKPDQNAK